MSSTHGYQPGYAPIDAGDLPEGLRWDTSPQFAGQIIEVQYGVPEASRRFGEFGAKYKRIIDRSIGPLPVSYYRLVSR